MVRGRETVVEQHRLVPIVRQRTSANHGSPLAVYWNHPAHGVIRVYYYRDGQWFPTTGRPEVRG